jgi:hypothetical protein
MSTFENIGYDETERQFHEKDQQLLAKLRSQLDEQRAAAAAAGRKAAHWMKCPKCGGQLAEKPMGKVLVDQCTSCGGVYFDAGELAMLMGHHADGDRSRMLDDVLGWIPGWQKGRRYFTKG